MIDLLENKGVTYREQGRREGGDVVEGETAAPTGRQHASHPAYKEAKGFIPHLPVVATHFSNVFEKCVSRQRNRSLSFVLCDVDNYAAAPSKIKESTVFTVASLTLAFLGQN